MPATALPSKEKVSGPRPSAPPRVEASILVRFVVTRDGRVVDPLLVLDGKASETTATGSLPFVVRDRYEAARVNGEPVASCKVIEILKSTVIERVIISSGGASGFLWPVGRLRRRRFRAQLPPHRDLSRHRRALAVSDQDGDSPRWSRGTRRSSIRGLDRTDRRAG